MKLEKIPLLEGVDKEDTKQLQNDVEFRRLLRNMFLDYNKKQQLNIIGEQSSQKKTIKLYYRERQKDKKTVSFRDVIREVEPYSFRRKYNKKAHKYYFYFYAYCLMHNQIHSFRVDRIKSAQLLNVNYSPRWEVEISSDYINKLKETLF